MEVLSIRHDWPEKAGFELARPNGREDYTFLHFMSDIDIGVNGKLYSVTAGACIFYSPKTAQWFRAKDGVVHNWIHIDSSLKSTLKELEIPENEILYPHDTNFISEIFRKAEAEFFSDNILKTEMVNTYITEFLIKFSRALKKWRYGALSDKKEQRELRELRQKILSEPEERWTVAKMSSIISLSPSRFHAVYKSYFGSSPMRDVIEARIYNAESMLLSDRESLISEIAEKLGYSDQYHFIRQFKAVTGETPAAYRAKRTKLL